MSSKRIYLLASSIFIFTACVPTEVPENEGGYYYESIYFGSNLSDIHKKGIRDGCKTAKGKYTKSHWLFKNKKEYIDAWFLGRNRCIDLLKIDENEDLIL